MSSTATVPRATHLDAPPRAAALRSPAAVLLPCLLGLTALVTDAVSGEGRLGIAGLAVVLLALAVVLQQAVRAGVGRPVRTSRLAAVTGTAASAVVAGFLSCVGLLERGGPEVTESAAFAASVAVASVLLLVVLPLSLVLLGWCVLHDRRLRRSVRVLPAVLVAVVAASAVAVAVSSGDGERWLQAAAVAAAGAVLTGFSVGVSRAGSG